MVHRVSEEIMQKIRNGDGANETGYIDLGNEGDTIGKYSGQQVCKLKYYPGTTVKKKGKTSINFKTGCWKGVVKDPLKKKASIVNLENDWVNKNIPKNMHKMLQSMAKGNEQDKRGFVMIPPGKNRTQNTTLLMNEEPILKYYQPPGHYFRECLGLSAASALVFNGYENYAEKMAHLSSNILKPQEYGIRKEDIFCFLHGVLMHKSLCTREERRELCISKVRKPSKWDPLNNTDKYMVAVLTLVSSDGSMDHAISISKNIIFDANFKQGLQLSKENLDRCCSSESTQCQFILPNIVVFIKKTDTCS
jgi:hypothetical protein